MTPAQQITTVALSALILRWRKQYWPSIYSDLSACVLCVILHLIHFPELSVGLALAYVAGAFYVS